MKYGFSIDGTLLKRYNGPTLDCDEIVVVPDGITTIGERAFHYCRGIHEIVLPDSVTRIEKEAFLTCEGLRQIKMPPRLEELGTDAFYGCRMLKELTIPEGIYALYHPFKECDYLSKITLPRSLTYLRLGSDGIISTIVYAGTKEEWEKVNKYDSEIKGRLLVCCGYDENQKSNPDDFVIENKTLMRYNGKDSVVIIPDGVESIAWMGLYRGLYRVVLPDGCKEIKSSAFGVERTLAELVLPKSIRKISPIAMHIVPTGRRIKLIFRGTLAEWNEIKSGIGIESPYTVECTDGTTSGGRGW